jgi:putative nucleotidyltransferase-like protein
VLAGAVMPPTVRPEGHLLLACGRTQMDDASTRRLRSILGSRLDWPYVLRAARWHGVEALVHWHLQEIDESLVPAGVREELRASFERTQRRNLFLTLRLCAVLKRFAADGIPAIPYKGPTLAQTAYGRLAFRQFADLDILVNRTDVLRAKALLVADGFRPGATLTEAQERALVDSRHAYWLATPDRTVQVELHWDISPRHVSSLLAPERLWERLQPVTLGGTTVFTLAPEVLLASLCEHGAKHLWDRLAWIVDIAELIRSRPDLDWARIDDEARRSGERSVALGLRLAADLLGAPVPEPMRGRVAGDATVSSLASQTSRRLFRDDLRPAGLLEQARFHLRLRDRWSHRLRYCWLALTTLTVADWEHHRLPSALSFLYYPYRLLRLLGNAHEHRH